RCTRLGGDPGRQAVSQGQVGAAGGRPAAVLVVVDWFEELKRRVPKWFISYQVCYLSAIGTQHLVSALSAFPASTPRPQERASLASGGHVYYGHATPTLSPVSSGRSGVACCGAAAGAVAAQRPVLLPGPVARHRGRLQRRAEHVYSQHRPFGQPGRGVQQRPLLLSAMHALSGHAANRALAGAF